jgi:hypothetical protein
MPDGPITGGCTRCDNLCSCTCRIQREHTKKCRYRIAACLSVELECEHGLQACPVCDPCTCGAAEANGAAVVPVF